MASSYTGDAKILDFITGVLRQPGLNISRFTDPLEGWAYIKKLHPDVEAIRRGACDYLAKPIAARLREDSKVSYWMRASTGA